MAAHRFIGVVDIGKTNAKYAVVEAGSWQEVAIRTMPNVVLDGPPYPHFDVERIWNFICTAIEDVQQSFPVTALSVTTHGASGVLLDKDGELAMPVLDYEHDGPDRLQAEYDAARPDFSETGSPRLPLGLNLGAQYFWQMRAFPEAAARVQTMLTYPQYWGYRLTGVMKNEMTSLGCHTDLWNPWTGTFSGLAEREGWIPLMAPPARADSILGHVTAAVSRRTGLKPETPVACGIHDSNASLYPHLVSRKAPFSVVSTGTWVICMALGGKRIQPDPARDTLVNVNAFGDPVPSARFMGGREFESLMEGKVAGCSDADLSRVLDSGIMLLPSVNNRSGPFQGRKARWQGGEPQGDGEYSVAVSLYLALMTSVCLELAGADGPTFVEGPFFRNRIYLAMMQAATGRPVSASGASASGTSVGAAMLAAGTNGQYANGMDITNNAFTRDGTPDLADYAKRWKDMVATSPTTPDDGTR